MVFTKKQEEELRELTYEALRKLTGRYKHAYTSPSSVAFMVAQLVGAEPFTNYQHDRIIRYLKQFYRKGEAKRIRIVTHSPSERNEDSSVRDKRELYAYRVSP